MMYARKKNKERSSRSSITDEQRRMAEVVTRKKDVLVVKKILTKWNEALF